MCTWEHTGEEKGDAKGVFHQSTNTYNKQEKGHVK